MVSPINNNISVGISPIISYQNVANDHLASNSQTLSKTSLDYTRDTTSVNMASQSAAALGQQRKDGVQYTYARTEKSFEEEDKEEDEPKEKKNKKDKKAKDSEDEKEPLNITV